VSDLVTTARTARESLARGLGALQSDPNILSALTDLAAPIAQAMTALHAIERSGGSAVVPNAEVALNHTRTALAQLQAQGAGHPAIAAAMEAVAASLGLVHSLTRGKSAPPSAQQQPLGYAPTVAVAATPSLPHPQSNAFRQGAAQPPPGSPLAATQAGSSLNPPPAPMPAGDVPVINADLGTNSPTNFYKGLSGNDVIDHGGLFVATYMIPKIGTVVRLKIALPGGYEFEANGVVRWAREQSEGGDVLPGFGAQLTQITPEARQLVYRYVRNREPLFHDDL
jgi:PilZ domain